VFKKIKIATVVVLILTLFYHSAFNVSAIEKQPTYTKVHYSDLFFGYDPSYLINQKFDAYSEDNYDVARDVFNDYLDSPRFMWTQLKTAISAATDIKEFFKLLSDANYGTDYTYIDAMDSANIMFATELLGENSGMQMIGDVEKITKPAKKIIDIFNDYEEYYGKYGKNETHVVVIEKFFDLLYNSDAFDANGKVYIDSIKNQFILEAEAAGLFLSSSAELFSYLKSISIGLMLEELRIDILDDIIANSESNLTLYEGMTRLRSQLVQGFSSYVVKTYMQDKVVDAIFSAVEDVTIGSISAYGFVSSILKTASWVLFDVIFQIPSLDEMLTQMVLREYSNGLEFILRNKSSTFKSQFDSDDVRAYANLFNSYIAVNKAMLKASDKLSLSSNESKITAIRKKYADFSYESYIQAVISDVSSIPTDERKVKTYHTTWNIYKEITFKSASDAIEEGCIYLFNGQFNGDLNILNSALIDANPNEKVSLNGNVNICSADGLRIRNTCEICGTLTVSGGSENNPAVLLIEEGAKLSVEGNIIVGNEDYYYQYGLINN